VEQRNEQAIAAAAEKFGSVLAIVDHRLSASPFVAGDKLSFGAIAMGAWTYKYFNLEIIERPSLPHFEKWYARLCERPAYQKHIMIPFGRTPEEWLEFEKAGAHDE
tara:strand:+ start:140 stop:457 length:318 start_codon:yes stop_codon:yes gene_type:complete